MTSRDLHVFVAVSIISLTVVMFLGCGGGANIPPATGTTEYTQQTPTPAAGGLPVALPVDQAQPWETVSDGGYVVAGAGDRTGSMVNLDSIFSPGVEWHLASPAGVSENHEAAQINSGTPGDRDVAWAAYRLVLEGVQPGIVSLDVNPWTDGLGEMSGYYVALADYSTGTWEWHGPFNGNLVRLNTGARVAEGADYLSDLGNLFIVVATWDSARVDVVGVAANPVSTPGPALDAPANLAAEGIAGGLILTWDEVPGDSLAGYQVYWSSEEFSGTGDAGVEAVASLTGRCEYVLPVTGDDPVHVRVATVDLNGDVRALSEDASATPLAGEFTPLRLLYSQPSCMPNGKVQLNAQGFDSYDWDLDGDGVYEVAGDETGLQDMDSSNCGMIRPAVRGSYAGGASGKGVSAAGDWVACSAVSVLVEWNSRPLAIAHADPVNGLTPLDVTFTGEAIDDDGEIVQYAWDFDDDGTYDYTSADDPNPDPETFIVTGIYNIRFRVDDNDGSYDVDTIAISVTNESNVAPEADLAVGPGQETGSAPHTVDFDASGSTDSDGAIVEYHWDFDGDGAYDRYSTSPTESYTYTAGAEYAATVRVVDDCYATDTASVTIDVTEGPVAVLVADNYNGESHFVVNFDASGSYDDDGVIMDYEWDLDCDGLFNNSYYENQERGHPQVTFNYYANVHHPTVRVTDNDGLQDTASVTITSRGWGYRTVVESNNVTCYGLETVDGNPAFCFKHGASTSYTIEFTRAQDASGETWNSPVVLIPDALWVHQVDYQIINGYPAIAYYVMTEDTIYYMQATDTAGTTWGSPVAAVESLEYCSYLYLAEVNGNPAIAYANVSDYDQRYIRATAADGSAWGTSVLVYNGTDIDRRLTKTLVVIDGYPAMSYEMLPGYDLWMQRASDVNGDAWFAPTEVYSPTGTHHVGYNNDLMEVDGLPALCFGGGVNPNCFSYIRCQDAGGVAWDPPVAIENELELRSEPIECKVIAGVPMVVYRREYSTVSELMFASTMDALGTNWLGPQNVGWSSGVYYVGTSFHIGEAAGEPVVIYTDDDDDDIYFGFIVD